MKMLKLFRPKLWGPLDLITLKWCAFLFGALAGAFSPKFIKRYAGVLAIIGLLLAIKPTMTWLENK